MTYLELFNIINRLPADKIDDNVVFVDVTGMSHQVSHTEYNDGSIDGMDVRAYQLLMMEI